MAKRSIVAVIDLDDDFPGDYRFTRDDLSGYAMALEVHPWVGEVTVFGSLTDAQDDAAEGTLITYFDRP